MAEEKAAPAEGTETKPAETPPEKGELKGTLLGPEEISSWGNESVIVEKKAVTEADGAKPPEEEAPPAEGTPETPPPAEVPEIVADAPEIPTVADPGEYTPGDYSFEVTIYDPEGKNGRTRKIASVSEWDSLLDTDPNFGTATALLRAQRAAGRMETNLDRDQATYNEKKTAYDSYTEAEEARTAATTQITNEIQYLVDRGELPPVAAEFTNADWSDPKVAAQPGVREQLGLLAYMQKENAARTKARLQPMTSALDAWNAYQLDQAKQTGATRQQEAGQQRRAAGARVASTSPAPTSAAPKGIAVGRGGSLNDLAAQNWSTYGE